jgi:hypothetical protein
MPRLPHAQHITGRHQQQDMEVFCATWPCMPVSNDAPCPPPPRRPRAKRDTPPYHHSVDYQQLPTTLDQPSHACCDAAPALYMLAHVLLCCTDAPLPPGLRCQPQQQTCCLAPALHLYALRPCNRLHTDRPTELITNIELSQCCGTYCNPHTRRAASTCKQWYEARKQ